MFVFFRFCKRGWDASKYSFFYLCKRMRTVISFRCSQAGSIIVCLCGLVFGSNLCLIFHFFLQLLYDIRILLSAFTSNGFWVCWEYVWIGYIMGFDLCWGYRFNSMWNILVYSGLYLGAAIGMLFAWDGLIFRSLRALDRVGLCCLGFCVCLYLLGIFWGLVGCLFFLFFLFGALFSFLEQVGVSFLIFW